MAKAKSCKCKQAECEECPEWIFTFADLVMLMMGFFVILWVLKPAPNPKSEAASNDDWIKVAASVREAFGYIPKAGSADPNIIRTNKWSEYETELQMLMAASK